MLATGKPRMDQAEVSIQHVQSRWQDTEKILIDCSQKHLAHTSVSGQLQKKKKKKSNADMNCSSKLSATHTHLQESLSLVGGLLPGTVEGLYPEKVEEEGAQWIASQNDKKITRSIILSALTLEPGTGCPNWHTGYNVSFGSTALTMPATKGKRLAYRLASTTDIASGLQLGIQKC